jgi:hypothetical protein
MKRLALALAVLFASSPALADERQSLINGAQADGKAGRWEAATGKLRAALEIKPSADVLMLLGHAETHLGRLVSAKKHFEKALEDKSQEKAAAEALKGLEPRIPHVILKLPESGVSHIVIDGQQVATVRDHELDPGEHTLVVHGTGSEKFQRTVQLTEGEKEEIDVELGGGSGRHAEYHAGDSTSSRGLTFAVFGGAGIRQFLSDGTPDEARQGRYDRLSSSDRLVLALGLELGIPVSPKASIVLKGLASGWPSSVVGYALAAGPGLTYRLGEHFMAGGAVVFSHAAATGKTQAFDLNPREVEVKFQSTGVGGMLSIEWLVSRDQKAEWSVGLHPTLGFALNDPGQHILVVPLLVGRRWM